MRRFAILFGCLSMLTFAILAPVRIHGQAAEESKEPAADKTAAGKSEKSVGGSRVKTAEEIKALLQDILDKVAAKERPHVLVIPIREEITLATAVYVQREMKSAAEGKYDLVVVDMDTPGGRIDAMMTICNIFSKSMEEHGIPVISWVNTDAYSAGAIICFSTDRITMATGGKMGAATVIASGPEGPIELPKDYAEKYSSAVQGMVRSLAKAKGHPDAIGMGMVERDLEVVEVQIHGRTEYLTRKDADKRERELRGDRSVWDKENSPYKELGILSPQGKLITLDYEEAFRTGLVAEIVNTRQALFDALTLKSPVVVEAQHNWSEYVFGFLAEPAARSILLLLGLMGLYMEFKVPGFGLPGIFGLSCLGLFFFSQYFMGLAGYAGAAVFLVGCVLLLIEIFVIPGFGVTGITGIILMVVGIVMGMQPFVIPDVSNPLDMDLFLTNLASLGVALIGMAVFGALMAKFLPQAPLFKRLILTSTGPRGELTASATALEDTAVRVGEKGQALSLLRPAGRVQIGKRFYDVVAEGDYIERGSTVKVVHVEGNRIVVRKVT